MKTYNITSRVSAQAKKEIERIINTHEKYKSSYFFSSASNASARRSREEKFYKNNPDVSFRKGNQIVVVSMNYNESCNNVYYKLTVLVKDEKGETIKNISTIKNLLK